MFDEVKETLHLPNVRHHHLNLGEKKRKKIFLRSILSFYFNLLLGSSKSGAGQCPSQLSMVLQPLCGISIAWMVVAATPFDSFITKISSYQGQFEVHLENSSPSGLAEDRAELRSEL